MQVTMPGFANVQDGTLLLGPTVGGCVRVAHGAMSARVRYNRGVGLSGLLLRFGERVVMEVLLVRTRRLKAGTDDPVIGAVVLGSVVMVPVLVVVFAVWLITGRGPGMRILTWDVGAPRQRPPR